MKKILFLSIVLSTVAYSVAQSVEFGDAKFYGKMNAKIGYNAVFYQGTVSDKIKFAKEAEEQNNPVAHSVNASVGFDVFYKATRVIHPFAGLEVGGSYALKGDFIKDNTFNQFLNVNARLGTSFKINRNLSIRPYGIIGFNVSQYKVGSGSSFNNNLNEEDFHLETIDSKELALGAIKEMEIRNMFNEYINEYNKNGYKQESLGGNGLGIGKSYKDGQYNLTTQDEYWGETRSFALIIYGGTREQAINRMKVLAGSSFSGGCVGNDVIRFKDGTIGYYYADVSNIELDGDRSDDLVNELIGTKFYFAEPNTFLDVDNSDISEVIKPLTKTLYRVGLNAGAGVEFLIQDRFTIGVEYKYSEVKFDALKVQTHNVGVKFGVQFL